MVTDTEQNVALRGNPLTRGRKFAAGELHLMVLALLYEGPRHGYDLIKAFGEFSNGFYKPSPGLLYPVLTQTEQLGHTVVETLGKRKRYGISDAGRAYLDVNRKQADHLFAVLSHGAKKMLWMAQAIADEEAAAHATGWLPEFVNARRALKTAVFGASDADHDEQRRVAAILRDATARILKK